ncbi:hypothetical protein HPP92_002455 [Vanilla planifolia]|uniref:Uncharacterized protein n=1 Tax=Vanilla planifolia TaxID=51239 RepID=A0A835SEQ7_VANPL|nr:hypothetical protein HPP92_002455 [Vanilla planifolia]
MVGSNAPFARKFDKGDAALGMIDVELLHRNGVRLTPGGWCSGDPPCSIVADNGRLTPGPGSQRLQRLVDALVLSDAFKKQQGK